MHKLMHSEMLRFRTLAIAVGLLNFAVLGYLHVVGVLFLPDGQTLGTLLYLLLGVAFGAVQMVGYRKPNTWAYLVHRPLSVAQIWAALASAAALLFAAVIMVPMLVLLVALDASAAHYIDARFYLTPLYLFGLALAGYFSACFIVLAPTRMAVLALALWPLFLLPKIGLWIFLPQLAVIALLGWLCRQCFRPDLHAPPRRLRDLLPMAFALQWGVFYAIFALAAVVYQFALMTDNRDPLVNPAEGSHFFARALQSSELVNFSLGPPGTPEETMLQHEVEIADAHKLYREWDRFPVRHQPHFMDERSALVDHERSVQWSFSHDQMLFRGMHLRAGTSQGWMGRSGRVHASLAQVPDAERFAQIPLAVAQGDGQSQLVTPRQLYRVDFTQPQPRIQLRHQLPEGDAYRSGIQLAGNVAVAVTDAHLYLFSPRQVLDDEGLLEADARVPLPEGPGLLESIIVTELVDGHLLTFISADRHNVDGWGAGALRTAYQPFDGDYGVLNGRALAPTAGSLFLFKSFVISPLYGYVTRAAWSAIDPQDEDALGWAELLRQRLPSPVLGAMLVVALLSGGTTLLLGGRTGMSRRRLAGWSLANLLAGLPGLVSFLLLTDWRPDHRTAQLASGAQPA